MCSSAILLVLYSLRCLGYNVTFIYLWALQYTMLIFGFPSLCSIRQNKVDITQFIITVSNNLFILYSKTIITIYNKQKYYLSVKCFFLSTSYSSSYLLCSLFSSLALAPPSLCLTLSLLLSLNNQL